MLLTRSFLVLCSTTLFAATGSAQTSPALDYGPLPVGFRTVAATDRTRMTHAGTTFDGQPIAGDPAMPMPIAVWYPAAGATSASMTTGDYRALGAQGVRTRRSIVTDWRTTLGFAGLTPTDDELERAIDEPSRASRDTPPRAGRFPVILSGLGSPVNSHVIGEYLASHGYVVITASPMARTGTLQASQPLAALETQTRNLEFLLGCAEQFPYADTTKLGVVGVNFDGMAAILFQMRNMRASAIVSVDGWEAKVNGSAIMRESPYFDPVRLRVPYLVFEQDETSIRPALAHDRGTWNALKYANRQWYVLSGMGHLYLVSDQFGAPSLPSSVRDGYRFVYGTIRQFLDTHVRKSPGSPPAAAAGLIKMTDHAEALPPAPTGEEFEALVMNGPIDRAAEIFRQTHQANPELALADEETLNLYAFRFTQQKRMGELVVVRTLAAEAFPNSATAAYNLGVAAHDAGETGRSRTELARALSLLDQDGRLSAERRDRLRAEILTRLGTRQP